MHYLEEKMETKLSQLKSKYLDLYNKMKLRPQWESELNKICERILKHRQRYEYVEQKTGVPWWWVAAIHNMESGGNWNCHLHNGDSLKARTVRVPSGRPVNDPEKGWEVGYTWEESAIDAIQMKKFDNVNDKSLPAWLWRSHIYNGFGNVNYVGDFGSSYLYTPYIWSGSNIYQSGKFIRDGVFDKTAISQQIGVAPIIKNLLEQNSNNNQTIDNQTINNQTVNNQTMTITQNTVKTLKVIKPTIFKITPLPSADLDDDEKVSVKEGQNFKISALLDCGDHIKFTLDDQVISGRNTWTAYDGHIEIYESDGTKFKGEYELGDKLPDIVNLPVPHHSQRNNEFRPSGTCNVTSVAMCISYFAKKNARQRQKQQLEDDLYLMVQEKGWDRHVHAHLSKLFPLFGLTNEFKVEASWEEIKVHLANKKPVIYSGRFTSSGHIIVIRGYDENNKQWIVNDPWGEYFPSGYQDKSGENLRYSYDLLSRISYSGKSHTWAHLPSD